MKGITVDCVGTVVMSKGETKKTLFLVSTISSNTFFIDFISELYCAGHYMVMYDFVFLFVFT